MKCVQCDETMRTKVDDLYHYVSSGLSNVWLEGVEVSTCPNCGETEAAIPRIEHLHKPIATEIVEQTTRLTGEEVRFLRKYLGLSGGDFSRRIDVTPTQLSRWERGHEKMSRMAERLLRLMVATELPVKNYSTELFDRIEEGRRSEKRVIKETPRGWSVAA